MSLPSFENAALLLVDVINDMNFEGGENLLRHALPAARKLSGFKARLRELGVPAIYVNDNFGEWKRDFQEQVELCASEGSRGCEIVKLLKPAEDDYFVLKPRHSGFYATPLEVLIGDLGIENLILTGFATDICVLYTANDAYMRDYSLIVPSDCVASEDPKQSEVALEHIAKRLKAWVGPCDALVE